MKKLLALSALLSAFAFTQAQEVQTYSVYDTDQNGTINVGDAVGVANQAVQNVAADKTQQYVTAEDLRALLQVIDTKLSVLEELRTRLNAIEDKLGIETPDANGVVSKGHEYVDLGITDASGKPIYWATCNVGAESAEEYGLKFAWGATTGYTSESGHSFDWDSAPFNAGNAEFSESAWETAKSSAVDANDNLLPANDAAAANWGGAWRMPTSSEIVQLFNNCYWQWVTSYNGKSVCGYVVYQAKAAADKGTTSSYYDDRADTYYPIDPVATYSVTSDPHIFLPARSTYGYYWTSTAKSGGDAAFSLGFNSDAVDCEDYSLRCFGCFIRPVCK